MNTIVTQVGQDRFYPYEDKFLPSVTTILGATYPKSKFLIDWQINQGHEEAERILKEAAEEGTKIHEAVEALCKGGIINTEALSDKGKRCVNAFCKWYQDEKPVFIENEIQVYAPDQKFAGTVDIVADIGGERYVIDLKTSNAIHDNYHAQVAAYVFAYNLAHPDHPATKAAILHVNSRTKRGYSFAEVDLEYSWTMFELCLKMFHHLYPDAQPKLIEYPVTFKLKDYENN